MVGMLCSFTSGADAREYQSLYDDQGAYRKEMFFPQKNDKL
jgi:hypothetical protein